MRQHCGIGEMDETTCLSFGCCWSKDLTCYSPSGKYSLAHKSNVSILWLIKVDFKTIEMV